VPGLKLVSFRRYVLTRKYHQGRGSHVGWAFIAHALGDPSLPDATSWHELRAYLIDGGAEPAMIGAANIVWRSYLSHISRERRGDATNAFGQLKAIASRSALPKTGRARAQPCASSAE
jgi:hypothetical protein